MLNRYSKNTRPYYIIISLLIISCSGQTSNYNHSSHYGEIEIYTHSSHLSKYSYILLCKNNICDTMRIYKSNVNGIILFYKEEKPDTIFICDRWCNASINSYNLSFINVSLFDTNYFKCVNNSIYLLNSEYKQICIPEIDDICDCY